MKKFLYALGLSVVFSLAAAPFMPGTALAADPSFETCVNLKGKWYANADEQSRLPTPTVAGLRFEGNDLIHHGATGSIENLVAGTYVLAAGSEVPDQPSFFSVEVRNGDGSGYATLRWNKDTEKWNMVTGGQFYENVSATELVKMSEPDKSSSLLSFGVGYTNSPPGTKVAVVSKVTFKGVDYALTCAPAASPSASASSAAPSMSPSVDVRYETCDEAPHRLIKGQDPGYRPELDSDGDGIACEGRGLKPVAGLPVTGAPVRWIVAGGAVLVTAGIASLFVGARRRKVRFKA